MSEPIIYIDQSEILDGKIEELKRAMNELAGFVEANEPQLIAYTVYLSEDRTRMTVLHVHSDSASLEFHMRVAGPLFPRFANFIKLLRIDVYGRPADGLLEQLRHKARMLGSGTVQVHTLQKGFTRFPVR